MIYAILEQLNTRDGATARVLGYSPDRQKARDEMAERVTKALEGYAILELKLWSSGADHALLANPLRRHGVVVEFSVVEVPEISET